MIPGFDEMPFGLAVDASVVSISEALDRFGNMDVDARRELGARGRLLCNEKYSWSIVYGAFSDLSKWIVGQSAKQPFVETVEITG